MNIRLGVAALAVAAAIVTVSGGAMAQFGPSLPGPSGIGLAALGIALGFYVVHRIRKK